MAKFFRGGVVLHVFSADMGMIAPGEQAFRARNKEKEISSYVELLKECAKRKDLCGGAEIHARIRERGLLQQSPYIASSLINMYAKCCILDKAEEVLEEISVRDVVSWSALITGYTQQGQCFKALECFDRMQKEDVLPNDVTFICILKACSSIGALERAEQIHEEISRRGLLEKNIMLGNTLVHMYAECNMLGKAHHVLKELPDNNAITWSALIAGYAHEGQGHEALNCFYQMQRESILPNEVTFTCILQACGSLRIIDKGKQFHAELLTWRAIGDQIVLGNSLVSMYVKCGFLANANKVLKGLQARDLVSWNTLISGYVKHRQVHEASNCFYQMQCESLCPDGITFSCILNVCGSTRSIAIGKRIHNHIAGTDLLQKNTDLGIALIDMYAKCGFLAEAEKVLTELPYRKVDCWNVLIEGYVEMGHFHELHSLLIRMQLLGSSANDAIFITLLKACSNARDFEYGEQIHCEVISKGLLEKNIILGTALVDMYAKCGVLQDAQYILENLPSKDVVAWNALIAGYAQHDQGCEALNCFVKMQKEGFCPNDITFISILKSCASMKSIEYGEKIHDEIISRNFLQKNSALGSALVDMYVKCGALAKAQDVLQDLPIRDVVSWNVLISGYAQHLKLQEALTCFVEMQKEGLYPDEVTFTCILNVCGGIGDTNNATQIHSEIARRGILEKNAGLANALVDTYAKCGMLAKAEQVLEELHFQDVITWNSLIRAHIQHDQFEEAFICFAQLEKEGLSPDEITFTCILKACSTMGAISKGTRIHCDIVNRGLLEKNIVLGTALVDMYAKCGSFTNAKEVLKDLPHRNVVSWNALITGYAYQGQCSEALNCFKDMQADGFSPNGITFLCLLNACSHSRKLDKMQTCYEYMSEFGVIPHLQHHTCMVMIYGNTGHLSKAMSLIEMMSSSNHPSVWLALLDACRKWGNLSVGRLAFDKAIELDNNLSAAYVIMSNLYRAVGMYEAAKENLMYGANES